MANEHRCRRLLLWGVLYVASQAIVLRGYAANSSVAIEHALPTLDGTKLRATLVEVNYPPGASSSVHTHACPVIGYVVSGAIRFQVDDQPEAVLHAGQSFYEAPNSIHRVSANASKTEPAKFLAYFVCDRHTELTTPVRRKDEK